MELDSTLATISAALPENIGQAVTAAAASFIPEGLTDIVWHAQRYFPKEVDMVSTAKFMLYFSVISLILGILGRIFLGKRSSLNLSVSSSMGILFVYAATVAIYTFHPWNLNQLLTPLPFVSFSGEYLIVLPITDMQFPALCAQVLSLVMLAFLVNLVDTFIPKGNHVILWLILRVVMLGVCMVLHLAANWAFQTYLPGVLVNYAPMLLLLILAFCLLSGVVNLVLGLAIAAANPFLGAMYTFFFSNIVGKQVSKAVFSTGIVCAVFYLLDLFGYTVVCVSAAALITYIPVALLLLALWYLIGCVL